jgi:hypothetical protein
MDCPYCDWSGTPEEYARHYDVCPKRPRVPGRHSFSESSPWVWLAGKRYKNIQTGEEREFEESPIKLPEESTWQRPVYKEMKKGDLIRLRGRIGELLSDADYKVGLYKGHESGLFYADVKWNDGETEQNFMVNLTALEWQPKHSSEHNHSNDSTGSKKEPSGPTENPYNLPTEAIRESLVYSISSLMRINVKPEETIRLARQIIPEFYDRLVVKGLLPSYVSTSQASEALGLIYSRYQRARGLT